MRNQLDAIKYTSKRLYLSIKEAVSPNSVFVLWDGMVHMNVPVISNHINTNQDFKHWP